jgi:hypothetical protein
MGRCKTEKTVIEALRNETKLPIGEQQGKSLDVKERRGEKVRVHFCQIAYYFLA